MKLKELLHGLDVLELHADEALDITGVQYDSRQVTPGALFVAISGFQTDGHKYIPKAMENGAVCVVCEKKPETDIPYVLVSNARSALAALGANWFGHPADAMCVVGITGTNGKTTSTYLLKHVLEKTLGAKVGLIGTIQNMIGDEILHTERTTPESFELQKLLAGHAEVPQLLQNGLQLAGQLGLAGGILGVSLRHKASLTCDGHHIALGFQLGVGTLDGVWVDGQLAGQLPDRGKPVTGLQNAGEDLLPEAVNDLGVNRPGIPVVQVDHVVHLQGVW